MLPIAHLTCKSSVVRRVGLIEVRPCVADGRRATPRRVGRTESARTKPGAGRHRCTDIMKAMFYDDARSCWLADGTEETAALALAGVARESRSTSALRSAHSCASLRTCAAFVEARSVTERTFSPR